MFKKGTDIVAVYFSDTSVVALKLDSLDQKYSLSSTSVVQLKPGIIEDGRILMISDLKAAVDQLFTQAKPQALKPKEVVICLPESKVFSVALQLPASLSSAELADSLRRKAAEVIPIEDQLLIADYQKHQVGDRTEFFYAATYQAILEDFEKIFGELHIKLRMVTVESLALATVLGSSEAKETVLLLDIGARNTVSTIVTDHYVRESVTIANAGDVWTKVIMQDQSLAWEEAETKKKTLGIVTTPDNTVAPLILPWIQRWLAEIKLNLTYWQQNHSEKISRIVLAGGSSQLPGLVEYVQTTLELPVSIGQAPQGLSLDSINLSKYLTVLGLAIMAIDEKLDDINFILPKLKNLKRTESVKRVSLPNTAKINDTVVATASPKTKHNRRSLLLLVILIVAILLFAAIWWRSQISTPAQFVLSQTGTMDYQNADVIFTAIIDNSTTTPNDGKPLIAAALFEQSLSFKDKKIGSGDWQTLKAEVTKAGGNPANSNDLYQMLLDDQVKGLWLDSVPTLTTQFGADRTVLGQYLDYSVTTSSPSASQIVVGSDQLFSLSARYHFLTVSTQDLQKILQTSWNDSYQQSLPANYKIMNIVISPLVKSIYQVHLTINGSVQ